jgi:hypothetical protein
VCPKRFDRCGVPAPFWPFHCASRLVSRELREEPRSRPCAALGGPLACLHLSILFEPRGGAWVMWIPRFKIWRQRVSNVRPARFKRSKRRHGPAGRPPRASALQGAPRAVLKERRAGRSRPAPLMKRTGIAAAKLLVEHRPKCGGPTLPFTGQRPVGTPVPLCYRAAAAPLIY